MATDVKNTSGGDSGNSKRGGITVKANRNTNKKLDQGIHPDYSIANFSQGYGATGDSIDGADLDTRWDDIRFYTGDAST